MLYMCMRIANALNFNALLIPRQPQFMSKGLGHEIDLGARVKECSPESVGLNNES